MHRFLLLAVFLAIVPACGGAGEDGLPPRQGMVNDTAGLLSAEAASSLSAALEDYRRETCHELVVLIVPSLGSDALADLSSRAMRAWQIGPEPLGNGMLLTISVEEGQARVDAGPALEGVIRSGTAEAILRQVMFPRFAEGDFEEGLRLGLEALMEEGRGTGIPQELRPPVCR